MVWTCTSFSGEVTLFVFLWLLCDPAEILSSSKGRLCDISCLFFFFCQTATGILAQTLVTTDSIDWPFKPAAHIRSDILIHMRNWNDTAQTQACLCLLMLPMFWLKKKGKTRSECLESFERKRAWTAHSSMQVSSHHYNMMVMLI